MQLDIFFAVRCPVWNCVLQWDIEVEALKREPELISYMYYHNRWHKLIDQKNEEGN